MNIICGENGMGKTNLLDAIYYLCLGKSYFTYSDKNVLNHSSDWMRIEGVYDQNGNKENVKIIVGPKKSKEVNISGKILTRLSEHIGKFPAVMVAPIDIQILLEGSENRRKFINNTMIQYDPLYMSHLLTYNRILKQRNAMLKNSQEKGFFDNILIKALDNSMLEPAKYIYEKRKRFADLLSELFTVFHQKISGGKELCSINYKSQLYEDELEVLLKKSIEKDKILGRTTKGIHKDDIEFKMEDRELKTFASQGQLKSFVLALKLAQFELLKSQTNKSPIILLDDIFAKLDDNRVSNLVKLLQSNTDSQIFISDTSNIRLHNILTDLSIQHKSISVIEGVFS
jgi:DNA replication and repair protein RecF